MKIQPTPFKPILFSLAFLAFNLIQANAQSYVYRPTAFTQPFVSTINSQSAAQTYLGIGSATNNALLTGTNVFTGTNAFTASKFFPVNGISRRLLFVTNNMFISSMAASASVFTNDGDFALTTPLCSITVPALLGSNSQVVMAFSMVRSNANVTAGNLAVFGGTNTNALVYVSGLVVTTAGKSLFNYIPLFHNDNSFTSQWINPGGTGALIRTIPGALGNTSSPFNISIGFWTTTTFTNFFVDKLWVEEVLIP